MRREDAFRRVALLRLRDELQGLRAWFYIFAGFGVLAAIFPGEDAPVWNRLLGVLVGLCAFGLARGIYHARPWARYAAAVVCLLLPLLDVLAFFREGEIRINIFNLVFLFFGIYLLLPSTGARFRRVQPEA